MTNEEAIYVLKNTAWLGTDYSRERTEEAVDMAIQALSQVSEIEENIIKYMKKYPNHVGNMDFWGGFYACRNVVLQLDEAWEQAKALSQEPCDVFDKYGNYKYPSDVELTEPNTATSMPCDDTVSIRKDALKYRVGNLVAYNVEWLKKHWQMEMDIVCGVKPCDDAISRAEAQTEIMMSKSITAFDRDLWIKTKDAVQIIRELPSVTQKSGKWIPVSECPAKAPCIASDQYQNYPFIVSEVITEKFDDGTIRCFDGRGFQFGMSAEWPKREIIAWMPLPKPYEPQERSDKE